jgi:hypothetical protein
MPPARNHRRIAICTISTRSHLAFALTLLQSAHLHAPDAARFLLLVDDPNGQVELDKAIKLVRPDQVVEADVLKHLIYKYSAPELCFAMKPRLLKWLLDAGFDQAHYLDGDTWLVGDFGLVEKRLQGASVQLTPHLRAPLPLDGRNPTELSLLRAGTFNAGYVGVAQSSAAYQFLVWWAERVQRWGINEPRFGMSGDQKWLDPVPNLFPGVVVSPDPGVNAAYWNLSGHELKKQGSSITVDGQPLVLLHLSGFDPERPEVLSRFQNRIDSEHHAVIADLLHAYAGQVMAAGQLQWSRVPYAYRRWWHSRFLPIRIARALLFNYRESRVNRAAQAIPPPQAPLNDTVRGESADDAKSHRGQSQAHEPAGHRASAIPERIGSPTYASGMESIASK